MTEFISPLKAWPGRFTLPDPDNFSGTQWKVYKDSVNRPLRSSYADTHLFGYAALEMIARFGQWEVGIPIKEVQSWETNPDEERVKLIAWIGREFNRYMVRIIDPKE